AKAILSILLTYSCLFILLGISCRTGIEHKFLKIYYRKTHGRILVAKLTELKKLICVEGIICLNNLEVVVVHIWEQEIRAAEGMIFGKRNYGR
ncbi:hypothetical protein A4A49_53197, partial [Nicotiana attenuata]